MSDRTVVSSERLRNTGSEVRSTGAQIQAELDQMKSKIDALAGDWQGRGSAAFSAFYEELNQGWSQISQAMETLAGSLDKTAEDYDMHEAQIAAQFGGSTAV